MLVSVCILGLLFHSTSAAYVKTPRINGGQEAQIEQFPYVASLRELGDSNFNTVYKHLCGAVIVSPKYLLTAAQCFYSQQVNWFGITVGTNKKNDETAPVHGIKRIVVHENYDAFTAPFKHDIALIELDQPLKINERVNQIPINGKFFENNLDAVTLGFGGVYVSLKNFFTRFFGVVLNNNNNFLKQNAVQNLHTFLYIGTFNSYSKIIELNISMHRNRVSTQIYIHLNLY